MQSTKACRGYLARKQSTQVEFWWMPQSNTGMPFSLPEGWAAMLWAARILTVSQRDWPESRMYLIPAAADSTAVDSIKSVSYFLTRIGAWLGAYQKLNCLLIKSLSCGFNLCGFSVGEVDSNRIWPLAMRNLRMETFRVSLQVFLVMLWQLPLSFMSSKGKKALIDLGWWYLELGDGGRCLATWRLTLMFGDLGK